MAIPSSLRLSVAAIAALCLSLALPAVGNAHGGENHGERHGDKGEVPDTERPSEIATPVPTEIPAEAPASTSQSSLVNSPGYQTNSLTPDSLLQRSRLSAVALWQTQPLEGGEIVGALIFSAPFALTLLKRRAQTKTALR